MRKLPLIAIIILSIIVGWQLFKPGFFAMHDDLHVMRLFEMRTCLEDGQIPCRWVSHLGFGYGQPLFNFYSAFPYYLGTFINLLGLQFVVVTKLLFWLSLVLSGIFTYLLANRYLSRLSSFIAAATYMIAPYHGVDIFVRGALAESWALALLPLVLYAISLHSEKRSVNTSAVLSLSLAAFLTTHNITSIISLPFIVLFVLLTVLISDKKLRTFFSLTISVILGIGLSAFFLFPALFEKSLIQSENLIYDYYNVFIHFPTVRQLLFSLHWGYGPSSPGPVDDLSFFVGVPQLISLLISPLILFISYRKLSIKKFLFVLFFIVLSFVSLFMTHGKSWHIWKALPILDYVQFPWRFLGLVMLGTAILAGTMVETVKEKLKIPLAIIIIVTLVFLNVGNFHFQANFPTIGDTDILTGKNLIIQSRGGVSDYLPKTNSVLPTTEAPTSPSIRSGDAGISSFEKRSNYFSIDIDVISDKALIEFPVMYFPGWTVYLNGGSTPMPVNFDNDLGLISVTLNKGDHLIQAWFEDTPVRTVSNTISFFSAALLLGWLLISNERCSKK